MEEYINNKKAMAILGIKSLNTLKAKIKEGLKCYGDGAKRRFKESEVKAFIDGFECPRMNGNTQFGKAHWEMRGEWRCCSHCGSMNPDDVIEAVESLGPQIIKGTTKFYKRYIELPGVKNVGDGPIKFYTQHFTEDQITKINELIKKEIKN